MANSTLRQRGGDGVLAAIWCPLCTLGSAAVGSQAAPHWHLLLCPWPVRGLLIAASSWCLQVRGLRACSHLASVLARYALWQHCLPLPLRPAKGPLKLSHDLWPLLGPSLSH